ncbi:RNA polymerase factor sigma-54 [Novosphingopyxis sp.]|uniref:RNA polymerase factor sigma-54 n=1 Tax=Novosphingopyxis sp. TaxID=2709690 RepID=UPI003B592E4F
MSLGPRLDLRQSQSLVMTPQLQQAIKLLALSNLEVEAYLNDALERNPLLASESGGNEQERPAADAPAEARADEGVDPVEARGERIDSYSSPGAGGSLPSSEPGEGPDFDRMASPDATLHEHLAAQAHTSFNGTDCRIALALIEQIDPCGYLGEKVSVIAARLGIDEREVERVLGTVQMFDPTGVGARDLAECLAVQAREADRYDPCMARLIDHLDLLAKGDFARLKRLCQVDDEDFAEMVAELREYDPKPGCRFDSETLPPVVPDIFVRERDEGWRVELNEANLPRLLVDRQYQADLEAGADKATRSWIGECLAEAHWLIKALDQRQRTIIKVSSAILKRQEAFFRKGVTALRPLTLREVAEDIAMHESTVSRVTSNKYLACHRGVYELKYFFSSGVASGDDGEAASAEAVKSHIGKLIDAEDAKAILSDDRLAELLKERGFDIARRTVAKYREAMGHGSSVQRRRQKKMEGL